MPIKQETEKKKYKKSLSIYGKKYHKVGIFVIQNNWPKNPNDCFRADYQTGFQQF